MALLSQIFSRARSLAGHGCFIILTLFSPFKINDCEFASGDLVQLLAGILCVVSFQHSAHFFIDLARSFSYIYHK
jgi:hypothetical protein